MMIPHKISRSSACVALAVSTFLAGAAHADMMIGNLSITGTDFDFGNQVVNLNSPLHSVYVTNKGSVPSGPLSATTSSLAPWIYVDNKCAGAALQPDETCLVRYQFNPSATGGVAGGPVLQIEGTSVTLNFAGTGVAVSSNVPVVANDSYSTPMDTALTVVPSIGVLANDIDPDGNVLNAVGFSSPTNGTLSSAFGNGGFTYIPNAGFSGTDSFTYIADNGALSSAAVTVTITVGAAPALSYFLPQYDAPLNSVALSNTVVLSGINTSAVITPSPNTTYSKNGGAYISTSATMFNGDTLTLRVIAASSYGATNTASVTLGGQLIGFKVTTLVSPVPALNLPPFCGLTTPLTISNLTTGQGQAFVLNMVKMLSSAVAQSLTFVEQSDCGTVILAGYNGGKLALVPLAFNTSDPRPNGIYAVGNGQYQVVRNNQSLVIAPALAHVEQLTGMLQGAAAKRLESGVMTATVNGLTYVVQPGVAVQADKPAAGGQLAIGKDGFFHFTDALGNNQVLYPAFADPTALRSLLQGMDHAASLNVQLDGTAAIVLNGKPYTLVPDMTLTKTPADRVGQNWWQESATRYWVINSQTFGTVQGYTLKP